MDKFKRLSYLIDRVVNREASIEEMKEFETMRQELLKDEKFESLYDYAFKQRVKVFRKEAEQIPPGDMATDPELRAVYERFSKRAWPAVQEALAKNKT